VGAGCLSKEGVVASDGRWFGRLTANPALTTSFFGLWQLEHCAWISVPLAFTLPVAMTMPLMVTI